MVPLQTIYVNIYVSDTYSAELVLVLRLSHQLPSRSPVADILPVASGNSDLQTAMPPRASTAPIIGFSDAKLGAGAGWYLFFSWSKMLTSRPHNTIPEPEIG